MSEHVTVWGRARELKAELKRLHRDAHQQDEQALAQAAREAVRVFEHDNFVLDEAQNHHR